MMQAFQAAHKAANARKDLDISPGPFEYIAASEVLSKYSKFMERRDKGKDETVLTVYDVQTENECEERLWNR